MKQWLENILVQAREGRFRVFILCLALVFVVASLNKLSTYYTNSIQVTLEILDLPNDQVLINGDKLELELTVTTYGFNWLRYAIFPPKMSLSVKSLTKSDSFYAWIPNKHANLIRMQLDKDVSWDVSTSEPYYLYFDKLATKKVPIELNASLSFAVGYDSFDPPILAPDSVLIVGPNDVLGNIKSIKTVRFELPDIKADLSRKIALQEPNNALAKLDLNDVELRLKVEKFSEGTIEVPIVIQYNVLNTRIRHFPKSTEVRFYTSLERFPSVNSEDFMVRCLFDSLSLEQGYLQPEITKWPSFVRNVKVGTSRVEFIVE